MKAISDRLALVSLFFALLALANASGSTPDQINPAPTRWVKQAPVPTWFSLQGVAALSPNECWIASAPLLGDVGELSHTTDGGRTWTTVSMSHQVNAVAFVDPLHGWAAGNAFSHTTDGGFTWRIKRSGCHVTGRRVSLSLTAARLPMVTRGPSSV